MAVITINYEKYFKSPLDGSISVCRKARVEFTGDPEMVDAMRKILKKAGYEEE